MPLLKPLIYKINFNEGIYLLNKLLFHPLSKHGIYHHQPSIQQFGAEQKDIKSKHSYQKIDQLG